MINLGVRIQDSTFTPETLVASKPGKMKSLEKLPHEANFRVATIRSKLSPSSAVVVAVVAFDVAAVAADAVVAAVAAV